MNTSFSVPSDFRRQAAKAYLLDSETEFALARAWRDTHDEQALHRLVTAYLRLAISMAAKFQGYNLPMNDLIQEAGVGLMKAASKFDPDRGVRFSTYAIWWIKAAIQEYVMRNWSLVRTGSTSAQKSLFFNMRRVKAKLEAESRSEGRDAAAHEIRAEISRELGVPLRDVDMMEARLSGADFSLNATQASEEGREWVETLEDEGPQAEDRVSRQSDLDRARSWLDEAFGTLSDRERMIIEARRLTDEPETLESLGIKLSVSKERVRQLELRALSKMRKRLEANYGTAVAELAATI